MSDNTPAVRSETDLLAAVDPSQPIRNLRHGVVLCDQLARSDLVPRGLQGKPANIFVVIMAGQEMGLTWPVSLRTIFSPGPGQVGMRGELLLAKLHEAGHEYEWEEDPGRSCTFTLERYANDPNRQTRKYSATFTIEEALTAGLVKRNDRGEIVALSRDGKPLPWMQYSPDMLYWRAVARCVKRAAPEVLMGFEVQGAVDTEPTPDEVELKVATNVTPPTPTPVFERATAEQLRILDERMRQENSEAHVPGPPSDEELATAYQEAADEIRETLEEQDTPDPTPEQPAPPEPPADRAKGQVLTERFAALGWDPRKHRADMMRACSVYLRRRVTGSRDMTTAEIMALAAELSRIQRYIPEPQHPVALADKVEEWRENWERDDPASYQEYAGD